MIRNTVAGVFALIFLLPCSQLSLLNRKKKKSFKICDGKKVIKSGVGKEEIKTGTAGLYMAKGWRKS